jgi:hypothetical protein
MQDLESVSCLQCAALFSAVERIHTLQRTSCQVSVLAVHTLYVSKVHVQQQYHD